MANMVLATVSLPTLLEQERTYLNTLSYRLYINDYTPVGGSVATPFTAPNHFGDFDECLDSGYDPVTGVGFTLAFLNGDDQAEVDAPRITWEFEHVAGDFTIYGYFVTDPGNGDELVYAQRDDAPFLVDAAGLTYSVVPRKIMDTYTG